MVSLIKSGIRLTILQAMYTIAITHILGWTPAIISFFTMEGLPTEISMVLICTVRTLNWLFTPTIIDIAISIWLLLPVIKLGMYFMHKVSTI